MVNRLGPVSNRYPSLLNCCIFPPGDEFFSNTVTSYPLLASREATANPPSPAPIIVAFFCTSVIFEPFIHFTYSEIPASDYSSLISNSLGIQRIEARASVVAYRRRPCTCLAEKEPSRVRDGVKLLEEFFCQRNRDS